MSTTSTCSSRRDGFTTLAMTQQLSLERCLSEQDVFIAEDLNRQQLVCLLLGERWDIQNP